MGWDQLKNILNETREQLRVDAAAPPVVCPIDGEILDIHPNGIRNCPMGNFTWRG